MQFHLNQAAETLANSLKNAIVQAIIALAKSLKLDLIAEGVENAAQRDFLIKNGCMSIQGHYCSPAVTIE